MANNQSTNQKVIASLALMESSVLSSDYLSTFLPFIATLTLQNKYELIEINSMMDAFKYEFGIDIPRAPMLSILSRATKGGLINKLKDGKYSPNIEEMAKISFLNKQESSEKTIQYVIEKFIQFAKDFREQNTIIIPYSEAVDTFVGFLDKYSPKTIAGSTADDENKHSVSKQNLFLMGRFVQNASVSNPPLFESIQKLAMAYLVSVALVSDVPESGDTKEFNNVTIYLDTPIVLRLLGLQTQEFEDSYREMFSIFSETIKPTYKIFQHTLDEIVGILKDCASWIDDPNYNAFYANPALLVFVERKFNRIQIELYLERLEEELVANGIEVDKDEFYNLNHHTAQIDFDKFKDSLVETYKENNPIFDVLKNEPSIIYDIRSIENTIKLWGTKSSGSYSKLGYIFMTSNSTLAYVSRRFTSEYWWDGKNHKSPCVTDYYLGTMVWLGASTKKVENFSRLKLLADCNSATMLSREVIDKFIFELKRFEESPSIVKDGDFHIIKQKAFEKGYLQNKTLNEEDAFKDDFMEQILEDAIKDIKKPLILDIQQKEAKIIELSDINEERQKKLEQLKTESELSIKQKNAEIDGFEKEAKHLVSNINNIYIPLVFGTFALVAIIIQFFLNSLNTIGIVRLIAGIIAFISVVVFIIIKANIFGVHEKLITFITKNKRIKHFKKNL